MLCRVFCALLFVAWTAERPIEFEPLLYWGRWRSPFRLFGPLFVSLPGVNLWAWQVLLFALAPLCLLRPGAFRNRAWVMDAAILASLTSILVTLAWGLLRGGSAYQAYYQLWRFLTALLLGALLPSVVRTSRDLKALGTAILAAALTRGTLAIYFYWAHVHGKIDPPPAHMTSHDDSLLFVAGLVIALSWALARGKLAAWLAAALAAPVLLYAMVLNNRRLAWVELALALAMTYLLLPPGGWRRRLNLLLPIVGPVLLVYVLVGWGRQGAVFAPVRALSTAGSNEDASSLARQEEIRNLLYTLSAAGNPLLGTGWGVPYIKVTSVYANFGSEWQQYLYLPHNSLLAVAVFGGLVGICGIWLVVPVAAFLATRGYRTSTRAVDRAAAMAVVSVLPAYGAQCFGDIGFESLTCALILGVAIAVAGKAAVLTQLSPGLAKKGGARRLRAPQMVAADADLASLRQWP
ncbi:MAG TPA: O-antigen ligase family protein [Gemmatimonadales bacterium]|nr:O-antigen ligase family protein [Gemmatimonadales bacterium]